MAIGVFSIATASAQDRKFAIGTSIDVMGGSTNRLNSINLGSPTTPYFLYYGAYPTVTLAAAGRRSVLKGSYSFGINRTESESKLHSNSHSANLGWNGTVSRNWKINLSDNYTLTDDSGTFNAFRAVTPEFDNLGFVFDPVARRIVSETNVARVGADYTVGGKSSLSFVGTHHLRRYRDDSSLGQGTDLADQQRFSGGLSYRRLLGKDSWNVGYTGSYFKFNELENVISHSAEVGYSAPLWRDFKFNLSVGASQTQNETSRDSYIGYNTSVGLQKTVEANTLAVYYTQTSGTSSGLGTISDTQRVGFSINRQARNVNIFLDIAAYDMRGRLGNGFNVRSLQGSVTLGIPVSRSLAVQGGLQYQRQDRSSVYQFDQKRVFVSLRYSNPALFTFVR